MSSNLFIPEVRESRRCTALVAEDGTVSLRALPKPESKRSKTPFGGLSRSTSTIT